VRLLRRNLVSVYTVYAASIVSGLVVTPIVLHSIGKVEFGIWALIGSLAVYLSLLDVGVGPSIVRMGAEYRGRRAPEETSGLASTGLTLYAVVAVLTLPVGLGLAWVAPLIVDTPEHLVGPTRVATLLLVLGFVVRFPLGLYTNLLIAQQRWDVTNLANVVSIVLYAGAVVVLIPRTGGLVLLAALTLVATLVRLVLPLYWVRRELPGLRFRRALVTRARMRELLSFSWQNFLVHIAARVVFSADVIVVGVVLGPVAAAFYALPARLFSLAIGMATAGTNLLYPAYAELEGADELERQRRLLRSGLRAGIAVTLLLALPFILIPDQLLHAWVGPGYSESIAPLVLLGCVLLVHQPIALLSQYLLARARQQRLAIVLVATAAANVALSVVLAGSVGIWGVAFSTLVTDLAAVVYIVPRLVAPVSGVRTRTILGDLLRPVAPALAAALVVLVGVARLFEPETLLGLAPLGALWVAAAAPLLLRFGLGRDEQSALRRMARPRGAPQVAPLPEEL
jgi:O-antigen/teichoic acid export membrane protein